MATLIHHPLPLTRQFQACQACKYQNSSAYHTGVSGSRAAGLGEQCSLVMVRHFQPKTGEAAPVPQGLSSSRDLAGGQEQPLGAGGQPGVPGWAQGLVVGII